MDVRGISKSAFLKKTGIKRGFLDSDKVGQAVSERHLVAIIAAFPTLNIEWLLTGKGQMLKTDTIHIPTPDTVSLSTYADLVRENERLRLKLQNANL